MIHGDTGLGKTHLLDAVGHEWHKRGKKVVSGSTDVFCYELAWAEEHDEIDRFHAKYRNCDLLLMGPLQFLTGKDHVQAELLSILAGLQSSGATIVLEADSVLSLNRVLTAPLTQHLASYMTAEIENPNVGERKTLCRELSKRCGFESELDESIVDFVAMAAQRSGRYVEAALNRISAYAKANDRPIDLTLMQDVYRMYRRDGILSSAGG